MNDYQNVKEGRSTAQDVKETAQELTDEVKETGQAWASKAKETAQELTENAKRKARDAGAAADLYLREYAWTSVALVALTAVMLGYFLGARRR
jgi:ElaB/YqjD/DUF883 family membrane-anchored ribosome-binding protein